MAQKTRFHLYGIRFIITLLLVMSSGLKAYSQTDMTSYITNPSFENDWTGWTHKNLGLQGNDAFTLKSGNVYVEKWTGAGGAVGSGSVKQVLTGLTPGNYQLTAVAQNIQQESATDLQTGAYIFAGDSRTMITLPNTYTVAFTYISGKITIGFEAVDASGNYICVDDFHLALIDQNLTSELNTAISDAQTLYGDGSGNQSAQLLAAIEAAQTVANNGTPTGDEQAQAIIALQDATDTYLRANATEENPLDLTSLIDNPSFEVDGLTGWTSQNLGTQGNDAFTIKDGSIYLEKWTGKGNAVGDAKVYQTLTNMKPGRYFLKAAAQNIQEDTPSKRQTGAYIYANTKQADVTTRNEYTLDFVLVSDQLELGFKAESASGNWLAVDNFRLLYVSDDFSTIKSEYLALITTAKSLAKKRTNTPAHNALQTAIDAAEALKNQTNTEGWPAAAHELEATYQTAYASYVIFNQLNKAISTANTEISGSTSSYKDSYQAAIDAAQAVYDDDATTDEMAAAATTALNDAAFAFRVENGTGTAPTVVTDTRFIRGCTWAFGRSTVSGSNILEQGFCWSEDPDPKVTDNRTTEYINQAGKIYWLRDLKPATVYYMRAYAMTKTYAVGYGDVIKVVTLPKGTVGHWYNNGGDEATNDRINYAINTAMDYYWNNLTSIHGFGISVSYSPGTPTADCSYGGSMRVGSSSSYQQPGTIMHESLHGIGVGTHGNWWSADYRPDGIWAGKRVTEALHFWDNNTTTVLAGDNMHMWPYGCNGAQEDTHNDNLYCMMGILAQALNEDGLPGSNEIGYALPYYSFNHDDGVKYYIKNEDEDHGLYNSFLVETATHGLQWKTMTAEKAATDDYAAWYLTFTPDNQYYQLRNAKNGYYLTYTDANGFKLTKPSTPTSDNDIHLMPGHVNVNGFSSYYFIHPESYSSNPPVLLANSSKAIGQGSFNIANTATTQRWLILTAEEAETFEVQAIAAAKTELNELIAQIRNLAEVPHTEDVTNADATLNTTLDNIEADCNAATSTSVLNNLLSQARQTGLTFLESVSATDMNHPFDLTYMIENPDFNTDATTGWTSTNGNPGYGGGGAEFYEKTFDYYQTLKNLPKGTYELRALAFQRPGAYDAIYTPYKNGTAEITTSLYIGAKSTAVKHICDDRQSTALFNDGGWGSDKQMGDGKYIPNCMDGVAKYFNKGLYDNSVATDLTTSNGNLKIGIKCTQTSSAYWTMFDHFRLYFYGGNDTLTGIHSVEEVQQKTAGNAIYDLSGRKINGRPKAGIYIVNGRKVVTK